MSQDPPPRLSIGVYGFRGIPSTYSGYETFLTVLLPELSKRGHDVTAYCRSNQVARQSEFLGVKLSFLWAPTSKQFGTLVHGFLCSWVARFRRHDVVLAVNPANALFCGLAKFTGQPVALNTDGQEWLRGKWGRLGRSYFRNSARLAGPMSTALISDSDAMRRIYESEFRSPSTVIPYCWTNLDTEASAEELVTLGLSPGQYYCIAGRLIPENNAVPVAEAYLASSETAPLVVLGTANYHSPVLTRLQELAHTDPRLRLAGHVADRRTYAALVRHAKVYIHAHSVGGINPSLVEAMGLGAAVLSLDTEFNREALGPAGTYFESASGDFVERLRDRAAWDSSRDAQARADGERRVSDLFSVHDVVSAVERLLVEVARSRSWRRRSQVTRWQGELDRQAETQAT